MSIQRVKNGRAWAVLDRDGALIALVLYRKGAEEILRRLTTRETHT